MLGRAVPFFAVGYPETLLGHLSRLLFMGVHDMAIIPHFFPRRWGTSPPVDRIALMTQHSARFEKNDRGLCQIQPWNHLLDAVRDSGRGETGGMI